MRRYFVGALTLLVALPLHAALPDGAKAPDFTTVASLAGKEFKFSLADALKKGPVVLYFYPAAFTPGCNIEAHKFAEAADQFKALGATVVGVSHDPIAKLDESSVQKCEIKLPVASAENSSIMKSYDSVLADHPRHADLSAPRATRGPPGTARLSPPSRRTAGC